MPTGMLSHKYQVVVPDPIADQLEGLAAGAGERPSSLAGQLVRHGIAQAANDGKVRPLRQAPRNHQQQGRRARTLA